jgi:hypothetical protein
MQNSSMRFPAFFLAAALLFGGQVRVAAQTTATPADAAPAPPDALKLQHDLERIRRELVRPSRLNPRLPPDFKPMFRVDVQEKFPDIHAWLGEPGELKAPQMSMPSAHAEFLRMVTPSDATASFSNSELLQVLVTGLLGKLALQSITTGIRGAIDGNRTREACLEVRQSLIDLNYERLRAGLGPVPVPDC